MIRPKPARWFEILAARDDAPRVLAALAGTRAVELEPRSARASSEPITALLPLLAQFDELALRYAPYWPRAGEHCSFGNPLEVLGRGIAQLRTWAGQAEPLIQRLQAIERERAELLLWQRVLAAMGNAALDFQQLGETGPVVHKQLFVFPAAAALQVPAGVLIRHVDHDGMLCVLVLGTEQGLRSLAQQCAALHGRAYIAPGWLKSDAPASLAYVPPRLHSLEREEASLDAALDALAARHDLHALLGDMHRLQWLAQNVHTLEATDLFCWITGWSSDLSGGALARAIERSGARALLHFPPAPAGRDAPLLLRNPWWARPFEIFTRALGMPSRNEADPSVLLALAVPLMFGYMFGDVGQGILIAAIGYVLRRRFAVARLLIAGGLSAAIFGFVFGSAFSLHSIGALWIRPLDAPLPVLMVPLFGGALLLLVGLLLGATEAHWRGELPRWLVTDGGLVVAYLSVIATVLAPQALAGCIAGLLLYCLGEGLHARSVSAALAGIAEFVERMVQLLINTLSFARVGAFALAHAGLSSAIVALVDASHGWLMKALVLVAGNVIVLLLETMVVSIQTTRLVLFEFFTRFLVAEGRVFRPLPPPPDIPTFQET